MELDRTSQMAEETRDAYWQSVSRAREERRALGLANRPATRREHARDVLRWHLTESGSHVGYLGEIKAYSTHVNASTGRWTLLTWLPTNVTGQPGKMLGDPGTIEESKKQAEAHAASWIRMAGLS